MSTETLKEKTTRGLFWGGMNNVVQQGLGLLFGIILGRLLSPHDYGMTAMAAARIGDAKTALDALLIDTQKNTYLKNGHNFQTADRLRLYLPGNGALLTAVAMMCAGWDGCKEVLNPGFPKDGTWNVRWEGLHRMQ